MADVSIIKLPDNSSYYIKDTTARSTASSAQSSANSAYAMASGALIYDHTYTISSGVATFSAHVYQGGNEVTNNYADSCFGWAYRIDSNASVSLGTGKTKAVTISTLGYGGVVIGTFTPPAS